jgi:hypothetical protein
VHTKMARDARSFFQLDQALCVEVRLKTRTRGAGTRLDLTANSLSF